MLLESWIVFNIFIAIYELYIIRNRERVQRDQCQPEFWSKQPWNSEFWLNGWIEYSCEADERYFDPHSYVYLFELLNVVCTVFLFLFWGHEEYTNSVLAVQAMVCCVYFVTLPIINWNVKSILYLLMSSLWILVPSILIEKE